MLRLWSLVKKEALVLLRDWHAMLLLFLMPALFILVMSLALQDRFAEHSRVEIKYYLLNLDQHPASRELAAALAAVPEFKALGALEGQAQLEAQVRAGEAQFLVVIPAGFGKGLGAQPAKGVKPLALQLRSGPGVEPVVNMLFRAAVREAVGKASLKQGLTALLGASEPLPELDFDERLLDAASLFTVGADARQPTAVQQNVPAWLVFAMFFIAVPLSTTWVQERQQGTYARLRSMGLPGSSLLLGKLIPYFVLNLVQVILMLAVGYWLVPALGGDQLTLGSSPAGLALMAGAASFAAVSYGLLIANLVRSSEQATVFTGVSNLLLAVAGVMVPRFIMPPAMQALGLWSPLAWGLEGFLEIILRQGGVMAALPWASKLAAFGCGALALAALAMQRARGR